MREVTVKLPAIPKRGAKVLLGLTLLALSAWLAASVNAGPGSTGLDVWMAAASVAMFFVGSISLAINIAEL